MPYTYTHLRFGKKCLEVLPTEYKSIVKENILYFNYGTLGPDLLNYHSPFSNKKFIELSKKIHNNTILETLEEAKYKFKINKERDAILSYILGYISHFLLDSYCNNYINKSSIKLNKTIYALYCEIDKYYYKKDKIKETKNILKDFKYTSIVSDILSTTLKAKEADIKQSISNFDTYTKIQLINNKYIVSILIKLLKAIKKEEYADLFLFNQNISNISQIIRIEKYFEIAIYHYKYLIENFINYLYSNSELDDYFKNTFINDKNEVEVLNLDNEKKYILKEFMK